MNRSSCFNPLCLFSFLLISLTILLLPSGVFAAGPLAGSGQHSLAISPDQPFGYAWGANQNGQIGFDPRDQNERSRRYPFLWSAGASTAATGDGWTQVASGDWHSVALKADGLVWTWGLNRKGQLGDGTTLDHAEPRRVPGLADVIAVAAGPNHSLAVTEDGRVWAWGENDYRQLGDNSVQSASASMPVQEWVPGTDTRPGYTQDLTGVVAVAASPLHSVALKSDGTVWAWGDNRYGQLGIGGTLGKATAQAVSGLPKIRALTAGGATREVRKDNGELELLTTAQTLALGEDGSVWGWGYNGQCQLSAASGTEATRPTALPNLAAMGDIRLLVAGGSHGVALTADGRVWTWGDNRSGQLGDATTGHRCEPVAVLTEGETLSAGAAHTLVIKQEGTVWAWGRNDLGQLGDGQASDRETPEPVRGRCGVGQLNLKTPPSAGCPLTVEVDPASAGGGTVSGAGEYAAGATVTLTATPDVNSQFTGWKPEPCAASFTMPAQALACWATFTRQETVSYPLTVTVNPASEGAGTVSGGGTYPAGATVTLTATPDGFDTFTGWTPTPCAASFTMPTQALTCTATFEPPVIGLVTLGTAGYGAGTVSGGGEYFVGETVSLSGQPNVTSDFVNWSPAPCATAFTLPSGDDLTCIATFASRLRRLEIRLAGDGRGAVACWGGDNESGRATPPAGTFAQVSAGWGHTCGVQTDGTAACWGDNWYGQATPLEGVRYPFLKIQRTGRGSVSSLSAGIACGTDCGQQYLPGTLVTLSAQPTEGARFSRWDGACLGSTPTCTLAMSDNQTVVAIFVSPSTSTFTQVSAGGFHTCGLNSDGTVTCWGGNQYGQTTLPDETFIQVSVGDYHTCGLKDSGTIVCWGAGTINEGSYPHYGQAAPPSGTFTQISAGAYHTCGVKSDGTVACWGRNVDIFGDTTGQTTSPDEIFIQVSAGGGHTCGVQSDGFVVCWGSDEDGQSTPP